MNETSTSIHSQSHSWENFKKFQLPPCHRNSTSWSHQQGCLDIYWWWFVVVYGCAVSFFPLTPDDEAKTPKAWQTFMTFCCIGPPAPCQAAVSFLRCKNDFFLKIQVVIFRPEKYCTFQVCFRKKTCTFPFWFLHFCWDPPWSSIYFNSSLRQHSITSTAWWKKSEIQPGSRPQKHFSAPLDLPVFRKTTARQRRKHRENITFMIRMRFKSVSNWKILANLDLFSEMVFLLHVRTPSAIWKRALAQSGLPELNSSKAVENP